MEAALVRYSAGDHDIGVRKRRCLGIEVEVRAAPNPEHRHIRERRSLVRTRSGQKRVELVGVRFGAIEDAVVSAAFREITGDAYRLAI